MPRRANLTLSSLMVREVRSRKPEDSMSHSLSVVDCGCEEALWDAAVLPAVAEANCSCQDRRSTDCCDRTLPYSRVML